MEPWVLQLEPWGYLPLLSYGETGLIQASVAVASKVRSDLTVEARVSFPTRMC